MVGTWLGYHERLVLSEEILTIFFLLNIVTIIGDKLRL